MENAARHLVWRAGMSRATLGALDTRLLERLDTRERLEMEPTGDEKSFTPPNQTRVVYTEEQCPQGTLQLCCCSI